MRNVSDTALWVAMYRAAETDREDAIFRDPFARRLAGERGAEILKSVSRRMTMDWPIVVRTAVMDELVQRCVQQGCKTVLNLAAGLDARPWRLPLPRTLRWIDADMPAMVAYKQEQLAAETPACAYEAVGIDLADHSARQALFERAAAHGPVLVMAEGLLVYLETEAVAALAQHLHEFEAMRWWLFDLASPPLLKMLERRLGTQMQAGNAPFRFGPAEGTAFFVPHGWREAEYRSTWQESLRLRRTVRLAWLWNLLGKLGGERKREQFRRFSGIVWMERA
ncbi:MAG: SAM-dependent methyltransferase [Planctomycetota bacterium]